MILAGTCIVVAAFFLLRGNLDAAFVTAAVGLVAWFLNYRMQMKRLIATADQREDGNNEDEEQEGEDSHD
jgi:hypothetical protein